MLAGTLLLAACSGGGDSTANPPAAGGFTLAVQPSSVQITQSGGTASVTVSITRTGGFTGPVSLSAQNLPADVTASFSPASIPAGSTTATVNFAATTAPEGSVTVTILGAATGVTSQSATFTMTVVPPPASITLVRNSPQTPSTPAGGRPITAQIIVQRTQYSGSVSFNVQSGLPSGVTASFEPATTLAGATVLTLTVATTAAPGNYEAVVRATGTGVPAATLNVPFIVLAQAQLTVGLSRNPLSISQGGTGNTSVTLVRNNFTGAVSFEALGVPAGVSATFGNNPTPTNGTTLTLSVQLAAQPGTYPITIRAFAADVAQDATIVLSLNVTQAGTGGNTTFQFCGTAQDLPIWFGYAPGNTWQMIPAGPNNTYAFDINPGVRFGIGWVTQAGADDFTLHFRYGVREELLELASALCPSPSARTVNGTVAGIAIGDQVGVTFGGVAPATAPTTLAPAFTINGTPDGARDLLGTRASLQAGSMTLNRVFVSRGLNPANNGSIGTVDFNGANSAAPVTRTATVQNTSGEMIAVSSLFSTATQSTMLLASALPSASTSQPFATVPAGLTAAGDLHTVTATAVGGGGTTVRTVARLVAGPTDLTLPVGAAPNDPNFFIWSNINYLRPNVIITRQADYDQVFMFTFSQQSGAKRRTLIMWGTTGWAGSDPTITLRPPDLTTAPGFQVPWAPIDALSGTWTVSAMGWTGTGGFTGPLLDGTLIRTFLKTGSWTP